MRPLIFYTVLVLVLFQPCTSFGTPSSTFWTPCTIDIQPSGVTHLDVDNYLGFGSNNPLEEFPTDIGPLWGGQLTHKLAVEYGFNILSNPYTTPFFFNAKVGFRENTLSRKAPAIQLGFWNFGTQRGPVNNKQNILYLVVGHSLPNGKTRLSAAGYIGNAGSLRSSTGDIQNAGYMVALDHQIVPGKWVLAADYASGKNIIGGGGVGVYYYFTPNIALLTGPVWFNDPGINGNVKASVQLDINF